MSSDQFKLSHCSETPFLAYKTLIAQEMLVQGYLAGSSVYVCTEHNQDIVDAYFAAFNPIFWLITQGDEGRDVHAPLKGPLSHTGFKRLN